MLMSRFKIARVTKINMYVENDIRTIMLSTYQDVEYLYLSIDSRGLA